MHNDFNFVEGLYGVIAAHVPEEWMLLLTSDEIPSIGLLKTAERVIAAAGDDIDSMAFARRWVFDPVNSPLLETKLPSGDDHQWRLMRHRRLLFQPVIHSCGFENDGTRTCLLPSEDPAYHFDWIVHSKELRAKKMNLYEELLPGSSIGGRHINLVEDHLEDYDMTILSDPYIKEFAFSLRDFRSGVTWVDKFSA